MENSYPSDGPLLVGLDMGSTNIKAVVYEPDGRAVAMGSIPTITHFPRPAWASWEPDELLDQAVQVLRQATAQLDDPRRIAGIAVASVGESGVPLDERGETTHNTIVWYDRRTIAQADWLRETMGEDELFSITGVSLQPIFSLCKLLWIKEHEPDAFARTARWLMVADYIAFKLCGEGATDHSLASRTLAFDIRKREWHEGVLEAAGMPSGLMAPTVPSGTKVGAMTHEASVLTGLPEGAAVCAGGHDHVCGAFAAGVVRRGQMLDSMGTAEGLLVPLNQPGSDPELGRQGYTQGAHVVPGKYYGLGAFYTSGASVDWARSSIATEISLQDLLAEADATPAGSFGVGFMPHLRLADPPHSDPRSRAAFVGISSDVTRGALMRAVLEGISYESRAIVDPLIDFFRLAAMPEITVVGGSSKNELLMRIKASVFNQTLQVLDLEEATALGAAMLAGLGAGVYRDVNDALATVKRHPRPVEPTPGDVELYERYYGDVFLGIYPALMPVNHAIHGLLIPESDE